MKPTSQPASTIETLVFLRHAEKPKDGLGQLTPQGLNRAIALATVLPAKYGKPAYIFAPNPAATKVSEGHQAYFYNRPLVTIAPTAISLGMPMQTGFGFAQIDKLQAELLGDKYAASLIFIAWEHGYEAKAVRQLVERFGGDIAAVPEWAGGDYDSLYVVRLTRNAGQLTTVTFTHDQEGLNGLSTAMPNATVATR